MGLKFRLRGLAETFIDEITCPCCKTQGNDDNHFATEHTKVSLEGIIVIVQCKNCGEIFVPTTQRLGVINPDGLRQAVEKDSTETGAPMMKGISMVRLTAEKLNAARKGELH